MQRSEEQTKKRDLVWSKRKNRQKTCSPATWKKCPRKLLCPGRSTTDGAKNVGGRFFFSDREVFTHGEEPNEVSVSFCCLHSSLCCSCYTVVSVAIRRSFLFSRTGWGCINGCLIHGEVRFEIQPEAIHGEGCFRGRDVIIASAHAKYKNIKLSRRCSLSLVGRNYVWKVSMQ